MARALLFKAFSLWSCGSQEWQWGREWTTRAVILTPRKELLIPEKWFFQRRCFSMTSHALDPHHGWSNPWIYTIKFGGIHHGSPRWSLAIPFQGHEDNWLPPKITMASPFAQGQSCQESGWPCGLPEGSTGHGRKTSGKLAGPSWPWFQVRMLSFKLVSQAIWVPKNWLIYYYKHKGYTNYMACFLSHGEPPKFWMVYCYKWLIFRMI